MKKPSGHGPGELGPAKQPAASRPAGGGFELQLHTSGPLPDPATLERYGAIIPDGADRIMKMAEREQDHRHQVMRSDLAARDSLLVLHSARARLGQVTAIVIGLAGLGLAYALSSVVVGTCALALVGGPSVVSALRAFRAPPALPPADSDPDLH